MIAVFAVVLIVLIGGIAAALAGRWQPTGLSELSSEPTLEGRFDVVLRGYRMDQVDAELARLHALIADREADAPDVPEVGERGTLNS